MHAFIPMKTSNNLIWDNSGCPNKHDHEDLNGRGHNIEIGKATSVKCSPTESAFSLH